MDPEPFVYEAKFGWNRQSARLAGIFVFLMVLAALPSDPLWLRITLLALVGGSGLLFPAGALTRRTALRADAAGLTMRRTPLARFATTFYPWEDIERVIIWKYQRMNAIGVQRRYGAVPLRSRPPGKASRAAFALSAHGIPPDVAATGIYASGWALDPRRLTEAVACFAPQVQVIDTTGRLLHPPPPPVP